MQAELDALAPQATYQIRFFTCTHKEVEEIAPPTFDSATITFNNPPEFLGLTSGWYRCLQEAKGALFDPNEHRIWETYITIVPGSKVAPKFAVPFPFEEGADGKDGD